MAWSEVRWALVGVVGVSKMRLVCCSLVESKIAVLSSLVQSPRGEDRLHIFILLASLRIDTAMIQPK
eukprot:scaffold6265_cov120-Skeletonema_marinoi.AAC.5